MCYNKIFIVQKIIKIRLSMNKLGRHTMCNNTGSYAFFKYDKNCFILEYIKMLSTDICMYFRSGTYSLTDEDGSCCGKQHGR